MCVATASVIPSPQHRTSKLVLVVLLAGYMVLASLIIVQGNIIDSQRYLIRQLFSDSLELTGLKMRMVRANPAPSPTPASSSPGK